MWGDFLWKTGLRRFCGMLLPGPCLQDINIMAYKRGPLRSTGLFQQLPILHHFDMSGARVRHAWCSPKLQVQPAKPVE